LYRLIFPEPFKLKQIQSVFSMWLHRMRRINGYRTEQGKRSITPLICLMTARMPNGDIWDREDSVIPLQNAIRLL